MWNDETQEEKEMIDWIDGRDEHVPKDGSVCICIYFDQLCPIRYDKSKNKYFVTHPLGSHHVDKSNILSIQYWARVNLPEEIDLRLTSDSRVVDLNEWIDLIQP